MEAEGPESRVAREGCAREPRVDQKERRCCRQLIRLLGCRSSLPPSTVHPSMTADGEGWSSVSPLRLTHLPSCSREAVLQDGREFAQAQLRPPGCGSRLPGHWRW